MNAAAPIWIRPRSGGKVHKIYAGVMQGTSDCGKVRAGKAVKVPTTQGIPNNACEHCFRQAR